MTKSIQQLREERGAHAKAYRNEIDNWNDETSPVAVKDLGDKMDALDVQITAHDRGVDLDARGESSIQDRANGHNISVDEATSQTNN